MTRPPAALTVEGSAWRNGALTTYDRIIPEEVAVSFTYNRTAHAVMMSTPTDLEDFAVGFSLAEGVITAPGDIEELDILTHPNGLELRMVIDSSRNAKFLERRRHLAGATGCGLCGMESLDEAMRAPPKVESDLKIAAHVVAAATQALAANQTLNRQTRAVHAAAFWEPAVGLVALREDVGRHNALDKLAGALARASQSAARGIITLTSRVSVELIQKAAVMGAPVIAAVSAPTGLALRTADAAGITLVAVARDDGFEIFTHPQRIDMTAAKNVA
jgi:FdhD protein